MKIGNDRGSRLDAGINIHKERLTTQIDRISQANVNSSVEQLQFSTTC